MYYRFSISFHKKKNKKKTFKYKYNWQTGPIYRSTQYSAALALNKIDVGI